MSERKLRLATRGSALALAQAHQTRDLLAAAAPEVEVEIVVISTTGDRSTGPLTESGGVGVFVKELETALLAGDADAAVHSLKDLPTVLPKGLELAAVLEREDPRDALVTRDGGGLDSLAEGALVATGSPRRRAQLKNVRPDLRFTDVRGNVDTRLKKLQSGEFDALVLAVAGMKRLGRADEISEAIGFDVMLPAPGQAAVAIEVLSGGWAKEICARIDHLETRQAVTAERQLLLSLGGGCIVPIGALARVGVGDGVVLDGMVGDPETGEIVRETASGTLEDLDHLARDFAQVMLDLGARKILSSRAGGRPLAGKRIIVTRPRDRAADLIARLEAVGAEVDLCSAIEIAEPRWWSKVIASVKYVNGFGAVAFTSASAARAFVRAVEQSPVDLEEVRPPLYAVGPGTAEVLRRAGLDGAEVARKTTGEGLAELLRDRLEPGTKVLWMRGEDVAFDSAAALEPEGLEVMGAICYYSAAPEGLAHQLESSLGAGVAAVVFASPSAVRNTVAAIRDDPAAWQALQSAVIACIGPTTGRAAEEAGLEVEVCPDRATPEDLVGGIVRHFLEA